MSTTEYYLPGLLLGIARNPMTAVGIPTVVGCYMGWPGNAALDSAWWKSLKVYPYPPGRILPIVLWIANYSAVGYASHIAVNYLDKAVSANDRHDLSLGLTLYYLHLGMSFIYTPILVTQRLGTSLLDCVAMTAVTFMFTKVLSSPTNGETNAYLYPYCVWTIYALWRAIGLWSLNY